MLFLFFQDRDALSLKLEDTENWLYEEGEDQPKQVYIDKLAELKVSIALITFFSCGVVEIVVSLTDFCTLCATETWAAHPGTVHGGRRQTQSLR